MEEEEEPLWWAVVRWLFYHGYPGDCPHHQPEGKGEGMSCNLKGGGWQGDERC